MFVNGANLSVNSVNCSLEDCSQKQSQKTEAEQELSKSVDIKIEFKYVKTKQGKTLLTSCFYVEHQHLNSCSNMIKENLSDWFKNWLGGGFWLELDNFQLYLQMAFWVNCSINSKELDLAFNNVKPKDWYFVLDQVANQTWDQNWKMRNGKQRVPHVPHSPVVVV